jgi:hypothetical protein
MLMAAFASVLRAEVTRESVEACGNNTQAILAMLPSATNSTQTNIIHFAAIRSQPAREAVVFAQSIGADALMEWASLRASAPNSRERNALIVQGYKAGRGGFAQIKWFCPNVATRAECIEFYDLVLRSVELTEKTKDILSSVKGDLLKLQDLQ